MILKKLNKQDAEKIFNGWSDSIPVPVIEDDDKTIREELLELFNSVLRDEELSKDQVSKQKNYIVDLEYGLKIYELLNSYRNFTMRTASDNDIWRFLSVCIIPDIVYLRWGLREDRFWRRPSRIWLKTIWWYIHLSWQGSVEETRNVLRNNSTDEIVQLVERAGPNGYRVNLTRKIMKEYGSYDREKKSENQLIFRKVMKLNTARVQTIEPELEGEEIYAKKLFEYFKE